MRQRQLSLGLGLAIGLAVIAAGLALAFSTRWSTHFTGGKGDLMSQGNGYLIGQCAGQNHSGSGSAVQRRSELAEGEQRVLPDQ
jgi:hypothetical protein